METMLQIFTAIGFGVGGGIVGLLIWYSSLGRVIEKFLDKVFDLFGF